MKVDFRDPAAGKPKTTIIGDQALLRKAVADALETSRFQRTCAQSEFEILFLFELDLAAPRRSGR